MLFAAGRPVLAEEMPQEVSRPTWVAGERWTYRHVDGLSNKVSTVVFAVEEVLPDSRKRIAVTEKDHEGEKKLFSVLLDADLNLIELGSWKYSPVKPRFRFPLKSEGEWSVSFESRNSQQAEAVSAYHSATITAKGRERVTIGGRTYDTIRFEYVGLSALRTVGYQETMRYWYAPSVKNTVIKEREYLGGVNNSYVEIWREELVAYESPAGTTGTESAK